MVGGQLYTSAALAPPENNPCAFNRGKGNPEPVSMFRKRQNLLSRPEIKCPIVLANSLVKALTGYPG